MLPITYYFRNSYKKSWYVRWKLEKWTYEKQVVQEWKDSNVFVKKLVDSVLEDQEKRIRDSVTNYEIEMNNADKNLKKLIDQKNEEEANNAEKYNRDNAIHQRDKEKVEEEYLNTCIVDNQKLQGAKELLNNLLEQLWKYSEDVKKRVSNQADKLIEKWEAALKHNTKLTIQEIKDAILPNTVAKDTKSQKKEWSWKIDWKSIGYLRIISLFCIFDVVLGYFWIVWFVRRVIETDWIAITASIFIAAVLIPIAIIIVHAAIIAKEKWWSLKQLWNLIIFMVVFLLFMYACQSLTQADWAKLEQSFFWNILTILQWNSEFLIRCFIIPSLFAWEIFIDLIDRDSVVEYLWIWKEKNRNRLWKLITNALYFLKRKKISAYAKEERKLINDLIVEMSNEEVPVFSEIRKNIEEIQWFLNPIFSEQEEKTKTFNKKIAEIKSKMEANLVNYNKEMQRINEKYQPEITKLENIKKVNEAKINKLNHDLNQASIDVKEWIWIWLID